MNTWIPWERLQGSGLRVKGLMLIVTMGSKPAYAAWALHTVYLSVSLSLCRSRGGSRANHYESGVAEPEHAGTPRTAGLAYLVARQA